MKNNEFNLTSEQRLVYLSMTNTPSETAKEGLKAEGGRDLHDEAHQALDRIARYRDELLKRLDKMDKKNPKYKQFENSYNELTDTQEKLIKAIEENSPKKQEVISSTFNKMNQIFKNPHLSIVRSLMIQKNLKEIKKAFTEEIGHLNAGNIIPLLSLMPKSTAGATVEDGKTYDVKGILIRREGDNVKLFINSKLYEFSTKVINGQWKFFDKSGKPLTDLDVKPERTGAEGLLGGLDSEDYKQKLAQRKTEVKKGPVLEKRAAEAAEPKKENVENIKITQQMRDDEFADLHMEKTTIDDSPIIQQYLNSLKKTPFEKFKAEITNTKGEKQNLAVFISSVKDKDVTYYRISTAISKPGTKTAESYKTEYWPKNAETKTYYGKDPIAVRVKEDADEFKQETERKEQNEKNFNVFRNEYKGKAIESFIRDIDKNDRPAQTILAEIGIKPPFASETGRDIYGTRYWFTVENKNNIPTIKLELQRAEAGSKKYLALEKTGEYVAEINKEPAKMKQEEANAVMLNRKPEKSRETEPEKEYRNAALKAVENILKEIKSNDEMKQFSNKIIKAENINLDGSTIENKTDIYNKTMYIAVRFRNKMSYVKTDIQSGTKSKKEIEKDIKNAIALLPDNMQKPYLATFNKNVDENIQLARKQAASEEKPQA